MRKSSVDYSELQGLRIALSHAEMTGADPVIIIWIRKRIKELEDK